MTENAVTENAVTENSVAENTVAEDTVLRDDLSRLSAAELDALPFGFIGLAPDGTIRKYNRYEADLARKDPAEVLGKSFFREVAPCTQVKEFEGRFRQLVDDPESPSVLSFDFEFAFRHGRQRVRIGFVRSVLDREVIVTVNRVRCLDLVGSGEISLDVARGRRSYGSGAPVTLLGEDFWQALDRLLGERGESDRQAAFHRLGKEWAQRHILRAERLAQSQQAQTLREVELQVALEYLSGSIGAVGLGAFDTHFGFRSEGFLLVEHRHSPLPALLGDGDGGRCAFLAGMHAGFFSYLSGRDLGARELTCGQGSDRPCRIAVGLESRLEALLGATDNPDAAGLLARLQGEAPREEVAVG